jgi:outer membrane protein OmpA-like peptidoglycan-associated protein
MRRSSNPWPAFVDLFSALLIPAFGGLLLLSAAYKQRVENELVVSELHRVTQDIHAQLRLAVSAQEKLQSRVRQCGDDTCIDLYIHFAPNSDAIAVSGEKDAVRELAIDLRNGLDQLPVAQRGDVEVIVEGHADSTQVVQSTDVRRDYLYNWNLSARRAASVVYEFRNEQLTVESGKYRIAAIGYADSQPLPDCRDRTQRCNDMNRRTTLRLRVDTRSVEVRLLAAKGNGGK